jgi:small subunit ribosomal protein S17
VKQPEATAADTRKKRRQVKIGRVVSNKMSKTIVVEVDRTVLHPRYHRYIRRRSRFMAHDEAGSAGMGDRVAIEETRPMSRRKRWVLREVLRKAEA